jgi:hypothetical protein
VSTTARRGAGALEVELDAVAQRLDHPRTRRGPVEPSPHGAPRVWRRRRRGVALRIGQGGEDRVPAHSVGDRVVQLEEQRGAVAGAEAAEDARLPERPRAVERGLVGGPDLAQQLVHVGRAGEGVVADVIVEVKGRIVLPVRQGEVERGVAHALCQARYRLDGALEGDPQAGDVRFAVEHQEHRHGGRLGGRIEPPEGQILAGQTRVRITHHVVSSRAMPHPCRCQSQAATGMPLAAAGKRAAQSVHSSRRREPSRSELWSAEPPPERRYGILWGDRGATTAGTAGPTIPHRGAGCAGRNPRSQG